MIARGFCEITLETEDVPVLERFYSEVIGLPVLSRGEDRVWLAAGRHARLGLWSPGRKEFGDRGGSHVHFAFSVAPSGLEDLASRLREHRVGAEGPVAHPGGDRSIYFRDPCGNVVEAWDFFERGADVDALRTA